jgi:hypothetical protein
MKENHNTKAVRVMIHKQKVHGSWGVKVHGSLFFNVMAGALLFN